MKIDIDLDKILGEADQLKQEIAELKFILKQKLADIEKKELQLQAFLSQADIERHECGVYEFGYKDISRRAFDQKLFEEKHPTLFKDFKIEKTSKKFEIKINK